MLRCNTAEMLKKLAMDLGTRDIYVGSGDDCRFNFLSLLWKIFNRITFRIDIPRQIFDTLHSRMHVGGRGYREREMRLKFIIVCN